MATEDGGLRGPAVAGVREVGETIVVELAGELDLHNAEEVRAALARPPKRVVVDMSAVEFVDSTVIAVLIETRKARGDDAFRIAALPAEPRRALHVAGVEDYLHVYESVDAALEA